MPSPMPVRAADELAVDALVEPTADPPAGPAVDEAIVALRAFMLAVQEFRQAVASALGLTLTDTFAMSYLVVEGPLSAGELSERLGLAASSVTALLDRLERAGIISRERSAEDRRAVTAVITEHGVQALAWARRWMESALADLGPDELPAATMTMVGLAVNLRAQAKAIEESLRAG